MRRDGCASGVQDMRHLVEKTADLVKGGGRLRQLHGVNVRSALRPWAGCPEGAGAEKAGEAQTSLAGPLLKRGAFGGKQSHRDGDAALAFFAAALSERRA